MSSYYENQAWQTPARQASWEQPAPPSRSGTSSAVQREDTTAFGSQLEEVDRAIDNLMKSGKLFGMPGRRDSLPLPGAPRALSEHGGPAGMPQRHHSVSEFDPMRSQSASNLQNFYATQRYQSRPSEAEQMMQAKRRMAAQRERELRNYHQEQQYNRSVLAEMSTQGKPADRAMSPSAMTEEERRELIARQHRALYGNESVPYYENGNYGEDGQTPRPVTQGSGVQTPAGAASAGARGHSPLAYDPFGSGQSNQASSVENSGQLPSKELSQGQQSAGPGPSPVQPQQRSRANSNASPASNPNSFSLFESAAQQSSRTSASSPGGSPPRQAGKTSATGGVAPIGTRPNPAIQGQAVNPALNKRSTTPLASPLSYGFAANENGNNNVNERSTSAASNPSGGASEVGLGWGSKSGVWGSKNPLSVQASVWG
ncbi:MAG: hypothetical protein M1819_004537 [Sarea resinae]|nr:MAG: hypothetical protein M1819_004537 [Sarea resinae]